MLLPAHLGEELEYSGDLSAAIEAQKNAARIYGQLGRLDYAALCTLSLYELYEARHDYPKAFEWYKNYQAIQDSLNTLALRQNVQELEVKYETADRSSNY